MESSGEHLDDFGIHLLSQLELRTIGGYELRAKLENLRLTINPQSKYRFALAIEKQTQQQKEEAK